MTDTSIDHDRKELGALPFVVAGLSFIPLLGVPFGLVSIAWGLLSKKAGGKKLAVVGASGIAFTAVIYSVLNFWGSAERFKDARSKAATSAVTSLVQSIEFYKTQYGRYPEMLDGLRKSLPATATVFTIDPSGVGTGDGPTDFHYELADENTRYYLLGVGPDGLPFTDDDILPEIDMRPPSRVGLKVRTAERGL